MIKIGNSPCSWGVFESGIRTAGYIQVLDEMKETGYVGTELGDWGFLPTEPKKLSKELHSRGLKLLAAFIAVPFKNPARHNEGQEIAVQTAHLLASVEGDLPFIVLSDVIGKDPVRTKYAGRIKPEQGMKHAEWQIFAEGVEKIATAVRKETGLRTVFHNHCAGYVETPNEVETLLNLTDSNLIGLCLDTAHYQFGGGNPIEVFKKHASRVWHIHFKDYSARAGARSISEGWDYYDSLRKNVYCELGQGDVDFPAITTELKRLGYKGWVVVELDILSPTIPKESARRNRDYLRNLGL